MKKHLLVLIAATTAALSAQAQTYMEVGYASTNYEESVYGLNGKASPSMGRMVLGYEVQPHLAIEGMVGVGMGDASVSGLGSITGLKFKIDNMYGAYAKPKFQFSPNLEGFLRIGVMHSAASVTGYGLSSSDGKSSFSAGIGLSYAINKNMSLNIDSMSYYSKNSTTLAGVTIGMGYKF